MDGQVLSDTTNHQNLEHIKCGILIYWVPCIDYLCGIVSFKIVFLYLFKAPRISNIKKDEEMIKIQEYGD